METQRDRVSLRFLLKAYAKTFTHLTKMSLFVILYIATIKPKSSGQIFLNILNIVLFKVFFEDKISYNLNKARRNGGFICVRKVCSDFR